MRINLYRVVWNIDLEATSPIAAAEQALGIQRDPLSGATVFMVNGQRVDVQGPGSVPEFDSLAEAEQAALPGQVIMARQRSLFNKPYAVMPVDLANAHHVRSYQLEGFVPRRGWIIWSVKK
jgi:hypothetical protein